MNAPSSKPEFQPATDPSPKILDLLSFAVSTLFLAHYYRYAQILLSGDAVAHINIARRVFDSRTPGPAQLGTVWLPLQHILTIPFVISDFMWSSGIGGAIPSMLGYVLGVVGIYRLVRDGFGSRAAAWVAAVIYGANPNLLYVQTTALNEPLSMALLIWATVWFADFAKAVMSTESTALSTRIAGRSLVLCGLALLGNILIRYDGWFEGCAFLAVAGIVWLAAYRRRKPLAGLRKPGVAFVLLLAIGPAAWFAWNYAIFGDPLDFMFGPYSAKAIEQRTHVPGGPHHPGWDAPGVGALYYLRDVELNLGSGRLLVGPPKTTPFAPTAHPGRWEYQWLPVAIAGTLAAMFLARGALPLLLLWLPLPFYALAIAWGGVPIFIPVWWPFSYYNTRYALELLPAVAAFWGAAVWTGMKLIPTAARRKQMWGTIMILVALGLTAASYGSIWRTVPVCLREVRANGAARYAMDSQLAVLLQRLPGDASILMYIGDHGGALQRAGVPLRRTINEGNYQLWERALRGPSAAADYIIATDGDPVAEAIRKHPGGLAVVAVVDAPWQRPIRIYRPTTSVRGS